MHFQKSFAAVLYIKVKTFEADYKTYMALKILFYFCSKKNNLSHSNDVFLTF